MHHILFAISFVALAVAPAAGQSLFIVQGERAAEGSVGWSVGPFSNGLETHGAVSLDGRWDAGFGFNRYAADFGGQDDTILTEWSPFVRYFLFKEDDDATPVSFAAHAAFFQDNFDGDDEGWYVLAGGQLYKKFTLDETLALYPFVGFSLAGESYTFGGGEAERAVYLTRQFGVHGQIPLGAAAWLRVTAEEHSFRRETYRAIRVAYVRRF
ncbi:MAG TPA: hypothetical protein VMO26_22835 [Vicinamibacterales bacterium]|nr:hypothetical protein [Vicinamibacterales bacterium]